MSLKGKVYVKYVMALNRIVRSQLRPNVRRYNSINDIDLTEIKRLKKEYGIGGMIIDVDGTILQEYRNIPHSVLRALKLLNREFKIYFVSNGKSRKIAKLANILGIGYIPLAFKQRAEISLNSLDICLESYAITTPFSSPFSFLIKLASPCVAFPTV